MKGSQARAGLRTCTLLAGIAAAISSAPAATATDYPSRPIRFLVGVVPGGAADTLARTVGQRLSERLKQQVVVDNRAGASQTIAAEITAKAAPDGHTILMVPAGHAINPALLKMRYDSLGDFTTIGLVADVANVLVIHPSLPARSVKEFIALAKAKPRGFAFGVSGFGAPSHMAGELFASMTQVTFTNVAYRGQAQAMTDLLAGNIQLAFPSIAASLGHIKAGKMIALGVTPAKRSSAMPDVPTIAEAGVPGYAVSGWYGALGPARLPTAIVTKLNAELVTMLQDPAFREVFIRQGMEPLMSSPEEFRTVLAEDIVKWAKVVKEAGIKAE